LKKLLNGLYLLEENGRLDASEASESGCLRMATHLILLLNFSLRKQIRYSRKDLQEVTSTEH